MTNVLKKLTAVLILMTFSLGLSAKHMPDYGMIEGESQEGLVKVDLPFPLVDMELRDLLQAEGSPIKSIETLKLDPINNTFILEGSLILPSSILHTLEEQANSKLEKLHHFAITLALPSPKLLSASRYVLFKIHEFKLDGIDYSKGFHIISNVLGAILSNRSLVNFFMDDTKVPTDYRPEDLSSQIKNFLDTKAIVFRDNTIRVRFALSEFTDLKRFSALKDLRLWHFSPILLKGTQNNIAFRIEAGMGKPGQAWVDASKEREDDDETSIIEARSKLYQEYSYNEKVQKQLENNLSLAVEQSAITQWNSISQRELSELGQLLESKARHHLSREDYFFEADPVEAHHAFLKEANDIIKTSVLKIKRNQLLDDANRLGGSYGHTMPVATKRLSQKALDQFTNFFRDFEFDQEPLFSQLKVALAPQFPGVVVKGNVNLNINTLLEIGLEGSGVEYATTPLRFDESTYGTGLPFELSLNVYMRDDSILELDVKSASLGEGSHLVHLTPKNQNGDFLSEFAKMVTVNVLKTYLISDPLSTGEGDASEKKRDLTQKIRNFKRKFDLVAGNKSQSEEAAEDLRRFIELDLKNPLFEIPAQLAETELTEFFSGLLGYDNETGRIQVNLSPKTFSEKLGQAENSLQIWNLEPLFDKGANKTFLELSVGDDLRTKKYINHLYTRKEKRDSEDFRGITGQIKDQTPVDYSLNIDLSQFKTTVNKILTASIDTQVKDISKQLRAPKEASFSLLEDLSLTTSNEDLNLSFSLNAIEKKKKSFGSRFFGRIISGDKNDFIIEQTRSSFKAKINLVSVPLESVKAQLLRKNPSEVFLGDSLIRVDLLAIGRTVENDGFVSSLINRLIGNVNLESGLLGKNLKKLVLKIAGPYLNSEGRNNGSTKLAGININEYAKVFTVGGEIYLQINPRIAGPVWDFYPLKTQEFNKRKIGIFANPQTNSLNIDFKSAFAPSSADKVIIHGIISKARELTKKIQNEGLTSESEVLKIYDQVFYNSDRTKLSLYHQFLGVLAHYQDLTLSQYQEGLDQFTFTSAGAELIHIASAATSLKKTMNELLLLSEDLSSLSYQEQLKAIIKRLEDQFIKPSLAIYKDKFHSNNKRLLAQDVTDWNLYVYPETLFAENTYQALLKLR